MIINEIPEEITFKDVDEETGDAVDVLATVMFISTKYIQADNGSGGESFVVVCYDSDNNVYEIFLNEVKVIKTKKYDKNRSPRDSSGKRRGKGTSNKQRNNNSSDKENNSQKRESENSRKGNPGEADGSKGGRKGIL